MADLLLSYFLRLKRCALGDATTRSSIIDKYSSPFVALDDVKRIYPLGNPLLDTDKWDAEYVCPARGAHEIPVLFLYSPARVVVTGFMSSRSMGACESLLVHQIAIPLGYRRPLASIP